MNTNEELGPLELPIRITLTWLIEQIVEAESPMVGVEEKDKIRKKAETLIDRAKKQRFALATDVEVTLRRWLEKDSGKRKKEEPEPPF